MTRKFFKFMNVVRRYSQDEKIREAMMDGIMYGAAHPSRDLALSIFLTGYFRAGGDPSVDVYEQFDEWYMKNFEHI